AADADPIEVVADWVEPLTYAKKSATFTSTLGALKASTRAELARGKAIVGYAELLKRYSAGALYNADGSDAGLAEAGRVLGPIAAAAPSNADQALAEIRQLIPTLLPEAVATPATPPTVEP